MSGVERILYYLQLKKKLIINLILKQIYIYIYIFNLKICNALIYFPIYVLIPADNESYVGEVKVRFPPPGIAELPKHQGVDNHSNIKGSQHTRPKDLLKLKNL
jgi:hypothetical protein